MNSKVYIQLMKKIIEFFRYTISIIIAKSSLIKCSSPTKQKLPFQDFGIKNLKSS